MRDLVRRDVERARDFAAPQNHELLKDDDKPREPLRRAAPTLVIHGTADPMFPLAHGGALVSEIPARGCFGSKGPATTSSGPTGS